MNTEVLTEVAVKDAQPVVEKIDETPPELEPAPPAVIVEPAAAAPAITIPGLDDSSLYIHRELSQLQFNIRVLEQALDESCLLYTSPSPRDQRGSRMPSSA